MIIAHTRQLNRQDIFTNLPPTPTSYQPEGVVLPAPSGSGKGYLRIEAQRMVE